MNFRMIAHLLVGSLTLAPAAQARDLLESFQELCFPVEKTVDAIKAVAARGAWSSIDGKARPELATIEAKVREGDKNVDEVRRAFFAYDGSHFAIVSYWRVGERRSTDCNVYEFDATTALAEEPIIEWLGATPAEAEGEAGVYRALNWFAPPLHPDATVVRYGYFAQLQQIRSAVGFAGNTLAVSFESETGN